ncbi:3-hydroxyacyl-CoA dehydrogenase/enoyl-CoA hydratase family protein [Geomonas sp. Red32]|uniref:3-hydroxyacyl-CoA dehydrogenase/enoyl-CoA hydratase family protein n=1 Tax=Geomonas sp. Red32 TaxID=2912856 RepID=UPI00202CB596|nr:3-hydroxyacyl-CoA dehydrogenase/enoyl-CoA hydratase family protein [Geomonas sp. Red32]MCM0081420.1 3-hydroxyacyl-CoA dehydrogenase/enoyl-CoA hydratase family protein [Geomonas sp. Red32]
MRTIERGAVLGAGVMGSAIAAHLANAGISVLLLDVAGEGSSPKERSAVAVKALDALTKAKPAPLYLAGYRDLIDAGNFDDDAGRLRECDWVIEAVVENLEIKKRLFSDRVVPNLKEGAILSTNTSGLSVNELAMSLPEELRRRFLVTHFFNPPRYMRLMEMVPCRDTDPELYSFMAEFIRVRLGKGIVHAKDTPNFIANRIGTYAGAVTFKHLMEAGLTVEEADLATGQAMGRPRTGTFALWDLVGIDTVVRVLENSRRLLTGDDEAAVFEVPESVRKMVAAGQTGNKGGKGFYRKERGEGGTTRFYWDFATESYLPAASPKSPAVAAAKQQDDPAVRVRTLVEGDDPVARFAWVTLRDTLIYAVKRLPEIADDVVNVDNAMKWGYNWELGPFETLDALGVASFVARAERDGVAIPELLRKVASFYRVENGRLLYYSFRDEGYREVPASPDRYSLTLLKSAGKVVEKNGAASLIDLDDGVFCLEFHSKMNTMGPETLSMIQKGVRRAERDGTGMVVANEGPIFSAGANLMLVAMAIAEGAFDEIELTVRSFQKAMMAIKYARVPVVAAPHNLAMGGSCETCLHSDAIVAHAETYMGLVEIGVGLLPAGGGTKEMAIRAIKLAEEYDAEVMPFLLRNYRNIAMAKVSMSAAELFTMGLMRRGDSITMDLDRRIHDAKQKAIALAVNYRPGQPGTSLKAPGRGIAAAIKAQLWNLEQGEYISAYDRHLASGIAEVITGGDVPAGTIISEQYLLDLEREKFLRFCGEKKTGERIQHMLKKGKPLRN